MRDTTLILYQGKGIWKRFSAGKRHYSYPGPRCRRRVKRFSARQQLYSHPAPRYRRRVERFSVGKDFQDFISRQHITIPLEKNPIMRPTFTQEATSGCDQPSINKYCKRSLAWPEIYHAPIIRLFYRDGCDLFLWRVSLLMANERDDAFFWPRHRPSVL